MKDVARDSVTAWSQLRAAGGLECSGRDEDIEEALRTALRPSAATLRDALLACSTDDLVRAFFGVAEPYVVMFRAILDFFQAAGAREGRSAWAIRIEDEHLDLVHFQRFLEHWDAVESELNVPAIDSEGAWAVHRGSIDVAGLDKALEFLGAGTTGHTGLDDVDQWLAAYARGVYGPFPTSLHPGRLPPELSDAAAIAMASVDIIRQLWPNRKSMIEEHRARGYAIDRADGFSPRTIAQHETDYRLGSTVACLGRYPMLDEAARVAFARNLAAEYAVYPRRRIGVRIDLPELERILSLPLWQKRHELYAVWLATEIVSALADHEIELHHEDGAITFAFRETVVATVRSSWPTVKLYAERRSPLAAPIGHGRSANVQPDYSLWRDSGGSETCGLVIEVKHYKRHSTRFREVMVDYARAHRDAKVVLVSHGPAREHFFDVDADVRDRCQAIGELTASHHAAREKLRTLVKEYVKAPISRGMCVASAVVIDISLSMASVLDSDDFPTLLLGLVSDDRIDTVLVDNQIRLRRPLTSALSAVRTTPRGTSTDLRGSTLALLDEHPVVLVVTDAEGLYGLDGLIMERLRSESIGTVEVDFVLIRRG